MPKVSVIIPTYQYRHFIRDAIDSVLAQSYKDYELIVVDDGSTDGTRETVIAYGNQLQYVYQDNRGLPAARNTGIRSSKGEYLSFLDADDVWRSNKLEEEVKFLDSHTSVGLVYSNYTYSGSRKSLKKNGFEDVPLPRGNAVRELFLQNPISSSAVMVRRLCFDKVGLFDESLISCEDLDMWLRIARCFEIDYIDLPLAEYRLHERNMYLETERMLTGELAMRRKCLESNPFLRDEIDFRTMHSKYYRQYRALGNWYLHVGAPEKARRPFWEYLKVNPHNPAAYVSWLVTFFPPRLLSWMRAGKKKLGLNW